MNRIDALRASNKGERADPPDKTVINSALYARGKAMGGAAVATGKAAYREEYLRDHGPDLDEWLDATESGREI